MELGTLAPALLWPHRTLAGGGDGLHPVGRREQVSSWKLDTGPEGGSQGQLAS